jgi:hypothetical protein
MPVVEQICFCVHICCVCANHMPDSMVEPMDSEVNHNDTNESLFLIRYHPGGKER